MEKFPVTEKFFDELGMLIDAARNGTDLPIPESEMTTFEEVMAEHDAYMADPANQEEIERERLLELERENQPRKGCGCCVISAHDHDLDDQTIIIGPPLE